MSSNAMSGSWKVSTNTWGGDGPEMGIDYLVRDLKKICLDISTYHGKILDDCTTLVDYLP